MAWHFKGGRHKANWVRMGEGGQGRNRYVTFKCSVCGKTKKEYPEGI